MNAKHDNVIYTIGHSTHPIEEFLRLLQQHDIRCLVDVRRFPTSKKHPQFKQENLANAVEQANIEYHWLGERLGGYRTGGYEAYLKTEAFQTGLQRLKQLGGEKVTAFMCAELPFFRCHRRFIADQLREAGWTVLHIMDKGKLYEHKRKQANE